MVASAIVALTATWKFASPSLSIADGLQKFVGVIQDNESAFLLPEAVGRCVVHQFGESVPFYVKGDDGSVAFVDPSQATIEIQRDAKSALMVGETIVIIGVATEDFIPDGKGDGLYRDNPGRVMRNFKATKRYPLLISDNPATIYDSK